MLLLVSVMTLGQTEREIALFNEVNNFRANPKSYIPLVKNYIVAQNSMVSKIKDGSMSIKSGSGKLDKDNRMYDVTPLNGINRIKANIKAANELLVILDTLLLDTVVFNTNMYTITKIHNTYINSIKRLGHNGVNGTSVSTRFKNTNYAVGENLCTLGNIGDTMDLKPTILLMLVDAGISTRGHRKLLIDPKHTNGSVGISSYKKTSSGFTYNSNYCIINLGHKKGGN